MQELFSIERQRIFVAGHRGMVGSALVSRLRDVDCEVITADRGTLDLTRQAAVENFISDTRPDVIVIAAAKVGGILANATYPVEFLGENILIETNLMRAAHQNDVDRLLFLGSSCIYPKFAPQPTPEGALLTGLLEPTNEAYAVAKIAGIKLCEAYRTQYGRHYISAMPTNLYGPFDNFDEAHGHVIPALMRKFHKAKTHGDDRVSIWGTGTPRREFMHVNDLSDALIFLLRHYDGKEHINVGTGQEISILELAETIRDAVECRCALDFDSTKPDGTARKLMDSRRLAALGWSPNIDLATGIAQTYDWYLDNEA